MSSIFYNCSSLSSLPNISKWNMNNVTNISYIFYKCSSLSSLPNISKWNINNAINMNYMFNNCSSLAFLPDISKWKNYNAFNIYNMLVQCENFLLSKEELKLIENNNIYYLEDLYSFNEDHDFNFFNDINNNYDFTIFPLDRNN